MKGSVDDFKVAEWTLTSRPHSTVVESRRLEEIDAIPNIMRADDKCQLNLFTVFLDSCIGSFAMNQYMNPNWNIASKLSFNWVLLKLLTSQSLRSCSTWRQLDWLWYLANILALVPKDRSILKKKKEKWLQSRACLATKTEQKTWRWPSRFKQIIMLMDWKCLANFTFLENEDRDCCWSRDIWCSPVEFTKKNTHIPDFWIRTGGWEQLDP